MEGSVGTLFNRDHPDGVGVTVQNVNREDGTIMFYMDPDGDELELNRNNQQQVRNDNELQANPAMYYVDWEIEMPDEPESPISTLPPGSPKYSSNEESNVISNVSGNNQSRGGKRKKRKTRVRKTRRTRKAKTRRYRK